MNLLQRNPLLEIANEALDTAADVIHEVFVLAVLGAFIAAVLVWASLAMGA